MKSGEKGNLLGALPQHSPRPCPHHHFPCCHHPPRTRFAVFAVAGPIPGSQQQISDFTKAGARPSGIERPKAEQGGCLPLMVDIRPQRP